MVEDTLVIRIEEKNGCVTFGVRVQPRASRTEIAGTYQESVKLKIAAPPVDNKANEECCRFLAKLFGVASGSVEIIVGDSSRNKIVRVCGVTADHVRKIFALE